MCEVRHPILWLAAAVAAILVASWGGLLPLLDDVNVRFVGVRTMRLAGVGVGVNAPAPTLSGTGGVVVGGVRLPRDQLIGTSGHVYLEADPAFVDQGTACYAAPSRSPHRTFVNGADGLAGLVDYDAAGHFLHPDSHTGVPLNVCQNFLPGGTLTYNPPGLGATGGCDAVPGFFGLYCHAVEGDVEVFSRTCLTWSSLAPYLVNCSGPCTPPFSNMLDPGLGTLVAEGTEARPPELFAAFNATGQLSIGIEPPSTPSDPTLTTGWDLVLRANFHTQASEVGLGDAYFFLTSINHNGVAAYHFPGPAPYSRHYLNHASFEERVLSVSLESASGGNASEVFDAANVTIEALVHNIWAGDNVTITSATVRRCTAACPCKFQPFKVKEIVIPPPPSCELLESAVLPLVTLAKSAAINQDVTVLGIQVEGQSDGGGSTSFAGNENILTELNTYAPVDMASGIVVFELEAQETDSDFSFSSLFGFYGPFSFEQHDSHYFRLETANGEVPDPLRLPFLMTASGWLMGTGGTLSIHIFANTSGCVVPESVRVLPIERPACPMPCAFDTDIESRLSFGFDSAGKQERGQLLVEVNWPAPRALSGWVTCPLVGSVLPSRELPTQLYNGHWACGGHFPVTAAPWGLAFLLASDANGNVGQQICVAQAKGILTALAYIFPGNPSSITPQEQIFEVSSQRCGLMPATPLHMRPEIGEFPLCDYDGTFYPNEPVSSAVISNLPSSPGIPIGVFVAFQPSTNGTTIYEAAFNSSASSMLNQTGSVLDVDSSGGYYIFSEEIVPDPAVLVFNATVPIVLLTAVLSTSVCQIAGLFLASGVTRRDIPEADILDFDQVAVILRPDGAYAFYAPARPNRVSFRKYRVGDSANLGNRYSYFDTSVVTTLPAGATRVILSGYFVSPAWFYGPGTVPVGSGYLTGRYSPSTPFSTDRLAFYHCKVGWESSDDLSECIPTTPDSGSAVYAVNVTNWTTMIVGPGEYVRVFMDSTVNPTMVYGLVGVAIGQGPQGAENGGYVTFDSEDLPVVIRYPLDYTGILRENWYPVGMATPSNPEATRLLFPADIHIDGYIGGTLTPEQAIYSRLDQVVAGKPFGTIQVAVRNSRSTDALNSMDYDVAPWMDIHNGIGASYPVLQTIRDCDHGGSCTAP